MQLQQQQLQKAKIRIPDTQRVGEIPSNFATNITIIINIIITEKLVNSIPNSLTFSMEEQAVNLLLAHAKETAITIIEEASSLGNTATTITTTATTTTAIINNTNVIIS